MITLKNKTPLGFYQSEFNKTIYSLSLSEVVGKGKKKYCLSIVSFVHDPDFLECQSSLESLFFFVTLDEVKEKFNIYLTQLDDQEFKSTGKHLSKWTGPQSSKESSTSSELSEQLSQSCSESPAVMQPE